jgi:protein-tyrosine phosphatase
MHADELPSEYPTNDYLPSRSDLTGDPVRDAAVWHRLPCEVRTSDRRPSGIWIGGDLHDDELIAVEQIREWEELGIQHVVDCREEHSDLELVQREVPWVRYTHVGVDDHGGQQRDEWFEEGVAAALATLVEGGHVYVHCHMGINRGPSMAFAVLLSLGWDITEALDAIIAARPIVGVIYAADAVRWFGTRNGWDGNEIDRGIGAVRAWHVEQDIDIEKVIRVIWMAD